MLKLSSSHYMHNLFDHGFLAGGGKVAPTYGVTLPPHNFVKMRAKEYLKYIHNGHA